MACYYHKRPVGKQAIHNLAPVFQGDVTAPSLRVELTRNMNDLHEKSAKMLVDTADKFFSLRFSHLVSECRLKIIQSDFAMPPIETVK
jgi:hypothetical protein